MVTEAKVKVKICTKFRKISKFNDEISGCENGTGRGSEEGINMVWDIIRVTAF